MKIRHAYLALAAIASLGSSLNAQAPGQTPRPAVQAAALEGTISLDGRLDEAVWRSAAPATDFQQFDPLNGTPATQKTEVRFVYGPDALYIGARMYDTEGAKGVRTQLARRDGQSDGDNILFVFDTYHDHAGRTMMQINPSGVKFDAGQASPATDPSWDPIWEASTHVDSLGWTAEMRIPFSQLRFARDPVQTWGMQIWRYEQRLNETSMWAHWGKSENGGPQLFGHLEGLHVPPRQLGIELMPYAVGSNSPEPLASEVPGIDRRRNGWRVGGDVKALISSSLTLDATFNPDFGQVEVDPAVVNLSAFETFFPEKRPFFVEGSGLFGFGSFNCFFCSNASSLSLFYSRRIGRQPQGSMTQLGTRLETPDNTTILGAAKVTGRTAGGYQIGILNALTASERASATDSGGVRISQEVEPMTNYFVGRVKRAMNGGRFTLGGMVTSVARKFDDNPVLEASVPHHSEAAGVDWDYQWGNRAYDFMGSVAMSQVGGDTLTIRRLQQSSARYFQRPDREVRNNDNNFLTDAYDPKMTDMRGLGAYARVAKQQGNWLWEAATNIRTPGYETNDVAFLTRADYVWMNGNVMRQWNEPTKVYRNLSILAGIQQQLNFDGDVTDRQWRVSANGTLANFWNVGSFIIVKPTTDDDRATRGGPVVRNYGWWYAQSNIQTDGRKRVVLGISPAISHGKEGGRSAQINADITFKPMSNLLVSLSPGYSRDQSTAQFVRRFADESATDFYGQRVVFSNIEQTTLSLDTRIAATFTPTLTLELFAQPFIGTGKYSRFKEFTRPRTLEKREFDAQQISAVRDDEGPVRSYILDPDRNPATANFQFNNPDFNVKSLRGNAVLRWEYRPGSTLFLVWQQERGAVSQDGDFSLSRDADQLFNLQPSSVFLVKMSYWLGR